MRDETMIAGERTERVESSTRRWISMVIGVCVWLVAAPVWAGEPTQFIKQQTDRISEALSETDAEARSEKFGDIANEIIDFRMLASRSLGEHWENQDDKNQEEFLSLLRKLLRANYEKKLKGKTVGEDYTIDYENERSREDRAIVETKVIWGEGEKKRKPLDYKLVDKESGWIIYDVVIDDISLEETYRESYTKIIEKDGWDALLQKMRAKIDKLEGASEE
jgi:phospholipid transport system substrate-binding protein